MMINGVRVNLAVDLPADDLTVLVNKVKKAQADTHGYRITDITVRAAADGGWDVDYDAKAPFERIRRITGRDARKVA